MLAGRDREPGAEVYCTATKESQAAILCTPTRSRWSRREPSAKKVHRSRRARTSRARSSGRSSSPLGADSTTLDGLNPHAHFPDEVHAHKDPGVWNKLDTAMGARRQPLTWAITTAGLYDPTSIGWQKHEYATQVLEGSFEDDSFFAYIAAVDEDDDPFDPENWGKANPNLGVSVYEAYMQGQAEKAKRDPGFYNEFLQLHLNRWTQQVRRWIQPERWKECDPVSTTDALERKKSRESALAGRKAWGGLDLSFTQDLASFALAFPGEDDVTDLLLRSWLPEATIEEQFKKGRKHYRQWVDEGWITATPGEVIDYEFIRAEINALAQTFHIQEIAFDPYNAMDLVTKLGEHDGLTMVKFPQGYLSMSPASKAFERRAISRKFRHGGQPVFAWAVGNAVILTDAAGNIKPDKEHAKDKIDPVVAAIMANHRAELCGGTVSSYLESEPLLIV
jgi:phage terminase large subunit-like protein